MFNSFAVSHGVGRHGSALTPSLGKDRSSYRSPARAGFARRLTCCWRQIRETGRLECHWRLASAGEIDAG